MENRDNGIKSDASLAKVARDVEPVSTHPVELVANERAFYGGQMLERGTKFTFDPMIRGDDRPPLRRPRWASEPSDPKLAKPRAMGFDTKPLDAQAAVKKKTSQF